MDEEVGLQVAIFVAVAIAVIFVVRYFQSKKQEKERAERRKPQEELARLEGPYWNRVRNGAETPGDIAWLKGRGYSDEQIDLVRHPELEE